MSQVSLRIDRQKVTAQEGQDLLTVLEENQVETSPLFSLVDHLDLKLDAVPVTTKLVEVGRGEIKRAVEVKAKDRLRININSGPVRQQQMAAARQLIALHLQQCEQCQTGPDCQLCQEAKAYLEDEGNFHFMSNSVEIDYNLCIGCAKCVKNLFAKRSWLFNFRR